MLSRLYIRNYALLEELELELGNGLNILTGETGAGKSLLLGAIGLILGKRVDYGMIFNPEQKCVVEAVFRKIPSRVLKGFQKRDEFDIEVGAEGPEVVIRREASSKGKSRAFINDTPVPLTLLREVTGLLVDLHGQHENQLLLSPDQQIRLLDQYAGVSADVAAFGTSLRRINAIATEIDRLRKAEQEARQQQDYYLFQLEELNALALDPEQENTLEEDFALLQNAEGIKEALQMATSGLYEDEQSLYNRLSEILSELQTAANLNSGVRAQHEILASLRFSIEEAARELESINDNIDLDPAALHELQGRIDTLNRLKVKFSVRSVAELTAIRDDFASKVALFDSIEDDIARLEAEAQSLRKSLLADGLRIEAGRQKAAKALKKAVDRLLAAVGLDNAEFDVAVSRIVHGEGTLEADGERLQPTQSGLNKVTFRIRTNQGLPMGSLAQIASGGEVSRVMLAIKSALAEKADLSVLLFDEIDTGISGETANKVGRVMRNLAEHYQLIAITHLPQIAGKGQTHFKIYKEVIDGKTVSRIRHLQAEQRVLELARMLSGEDPSPSAIENAKELLVDS